LQGIDRSAVQVQCGLLSEPGILTESEGEYQSGSAERSGHNPLHIPAIQILSGWRRHADKCCHHVSKPWMPLVPAAGGWTTVCFPRHAQDWSATPYPERNGNQLHLNDPGSAGSPQFAMLVEVVGRGETPHGPLGVDRIRLPGQSRRAGCSSVNSSVPCHTLPTRSSRRMGWHLADAHRTAFGPPAWPTSRS
jgi:hypothetical protein